MQIYGEKSEKYFIFAGLLGSFEGIRVKMLFFLEEIKNAAARPYWSLRN